MNAILRLYSMGPFHYHKITPSFCFTAFLAFLIKKFWWVIGGCCNLQIIIPFSNGLIFGSFWLCLSRGFYQDWKSLKTHIYSFYIITYNNEFYLPKAFPNWTVKIYLYWSLLFDDAQLKKKEAFSQNKHTPANLAYYMLFINID